MKKTWNKILAGSLALFMIVGSAGMQPAVFAKEQTGGEVYISESGEEPQQVLAENAENGGTDSGEGSYGDKSGQGSSGEGTGLQGDGLQDSGQNGGVQTGGQQTSGQQDAGQQDSGQDAAGQNTSGQNDAEKPENQDNPEQTESPAFSAQQTLDGVKIAVSAEGGIFPEGAQLSVRKVPAAEQGSIDQAIEEKRDDEVKVAVSYTFDIRVLDAAGNELQPKEGQKVSVAISAPETKNQNLSASVWHVAKEEQKGNAGLEAEQLDCTEKDDTVTAQADGFSYFTVEFTYGLLTYSLAGLSEVPLKQILQAVGLVGEAEGVEVSNPELFSAEKKDSGEWVVRAVKAFGSREWMKVTIGGIVYEITVTDDEIVEIYQADEAEMNNPDVTYVIYGRKNSTENTTSGKYLIVPKDSGSAEKPITIILDNVNVTQEHSNPKKSYITVESGSNVVIKLRGENYIKAWSHDEFGSDDGMAGIHVSSGATVKVTSEDGDGSVLGLLDVHGGGGKYGGAGIGTRYNEDTGHIIIAGGTIRAYGGHCAAGIGSGRDGKAVNIEITGGSIYAEGGEYAAGIGAGDNVSAGEGGDLVDLSITGGTITANGGGNAAGIGCSEGGSLRGTISIRDAVVNATGGSKAAGIGGGERGQIKGGAGIVIYSGTITAVGGSRAAGIGGGSGTDFEDNSSLLIWDGVINATGGSKGAGIGGGDDTVFSSDTTFIINGGEITAVGGEEAAGIGGGSSNDGVSVWITDVRRIDATGGKGGSGIGSGSYNKCESIQIDLHGGEIRAVAGSGAAGIGAGFEMGEIKISGHGKIEAYGGKNGAGIGAGNDGEQSGPITIIGDTNGRIGTRGTAPDGSRQLEITAMASYGRVEEGDGYSYENEAAAIGSGKATSKDITVKNAVLYTKADCQGADIGGGGYHITAGGTIKNITIDNCEIHSSSTHKVAPGIGSGYGGSVNNITITNTYYSGGGIGGAPMDINYRGLNSVDTITIKNCDITAVWDEEKPGKFVGGHDWMGNPLDHAAAGIGSGQYGSVDSITIEDSKVVASGFGSGAGIGGGGAGGNGFTVLDLKKWAIGDVGTITISGSDVTASSGTAKFDEHTPIQIYDGTVFYQIENPKMLGGGAGIGSGSSSGIAKIDIHDCGRIEARGDGAGIGAGCGTGNVKSGWVDYLWLDNIDYVYASAGRDSAGIGAGGGDGLLTADSGALKQLYINQCRDLTAYGGEGGAGIGLGLGSPSYYHIDPTEKGDWPLEIRDSKVFAKGGASAAGIGGGFEDKATRTGGENPRMRIVGKCQVVAIGGEGLLFEAKNGRHGGDAGIGGGTDGACGYIQIELTEDSSCASLGTYENPEASKYYVKATGTDGGAGIGCGGNSWQARSNGIHNDADGGSITIKKGAVFARGGDSAYTAQQGWVLPDEYYTTGAGAGIGGGSAGSVVDDISISGGYILAKAGTSRYTSDSAYDIGSGGDWETGDGKNDRSCGSLRITDGTVIAESISNFSDQRRISGGSIMPVEKNATEADSTSSTKVYRTRLKIKDGAYKKVTVKTTKSYGNSHIYADADGWIYLYLREQGDSDGDYSQWADVTVDGQTLHYIGYTDTKHEGILKLEWEPIPFIVQEPVHAGDDFEALLEDTDEYFRDCTWTFSASGTATENPSGSIVRSPGAKMSLHADSVGLATLSGTAEATADPDLYWGTGAYGEVFVINPPATIAIVGLTSKTYDTLPAKGPEVETESNGEISYNWYTQDGSTRLDSPPVDAGTYKVEAVAAATDVYESVTSEKVDYTIYKAQTRLTQTASLSEGTVTLTGEVHGVYSVKPRTMIYFLFIDNDGKTLFSESDYIVEQDGHFTTTITVENVPEGRYRVAVNCNLQDSNYQNPPASECWYVKENENRQLSADDITAVYGDAPVNLSAVTDHPGTHDEYTFEVVSDSADEIRERTGLDVEETVTVTPDPDVPGQALVTLRHAGSAVIRIALKDTSGSVYNDTETYVNVTVNPAEMTVSSYAYRLSGNPDTPVTSVHYGKINTLGFGLKYDEAQFKNGDTAADFIHGSGSLEAVPLTETLGASDTAYPVGINRDGGQQGLFYSRDYELVLDTASYAVTVEKASISVQALSTEVVYGEPDPELSWGIRASTYDDGLAPWDTADDIFTAGKGPTVSLDTGHTGGQDFPMINAGVYYNALTVAGGESANYQVTHWTGTLTVDPADIGDTERFTVTPEEDGAVTYDGTSHAPVIVDTIFDSPYTLVEDTDYRPEYPEGTDAGYTTFAGSVEAVLTGIAALGEDGNYTGTRSVNYSIRPCSVRVKTESAEKLYDGTPLTADGTAEGIPEADSGKAVFAVSGSQTEPGSSENTWSLTFADEEMSDSYIVSEDKVGTLTVYSNNLADFTLSQPKDVVYSGQEQRQPVTVTDAAGGELAEGTDYTLTYTDRTAAGEQDEITDAGTVTVTASGTGRYTGTASVSYRITPAPLEINTEDAEKVYDGDPLTAGGSLTGLVNGETAALAATGSQTNVGSSSNTYRIDWNGTAKEANYYAAREKLGKLTVTPAEGNIRFTESPEKVYDSRPVSEPAVETAGTGAVTYRWYDGSGALLADAPVKAGSYKVTAEQEADANHYACSAELAFEIRKAQTVITQQVSGTGTSETVTAFVTGTCEADGAEGKIGFAVIKDGESVVSREEQVTRLADGRLTAEISYDSVPAGEYQITVTYEPGSGNYEASSNTENYNKALIKRTITVQEGWAKTYGDAEFFLGASTDAATGRDVWSYAVTYDSFAQYGAPEAVAVDEAGTVTVNHAGKAVIEITLTDGGAGIYEDAKAYVTVVVEKAPLTVTSYAYSDGGEVSEAVYGTTGLLQAGLRFEGLKADKGDTPETFTHGFGTLAAEQPVPAMAAAEEPYEIGIIKNGVSVQVGDTQYDSLFLARDYEVTYVCGTLKVVPADISDAGRFTAQEPADVTYDGREHKQSVVLYDSAPDIRANLTEGTAYTAVWSGDTVNAGTVSLTLNGADSYTGIRAYSCDILPRELKVKTDSAEKVYDGSPLTAPGSVTGLVSGERVTFAATGSQTDAGASENTYRILWNDTAKEANYTVGEEDLGTLTVTPAEGEIRILEDPSKTYDGTPVETPAVQTDGTGAITYHWADDYGRALAGPPKDAGLYVVKAEQKADRNHTACSDVKDFSISPAPTATAQEAQNTGDSVTVTALVTGTYKEDGAGGNVRFTVIYDGETVDEYLTPVRQDPDGKLRAEFIGWVVPAGDYRVRTAYEPNSGNYQGSEDECEYHRDLINRTISVQTPPVKIYGEDSFTLEAMVQPGKESERDVWSYQVIEDSFSAYGPEPAVSVDGTGKVSILHAGRSVIEVTLSDGNYVYNDVKAQVVVTVTRAQLTVTSYAFTSKGDAETAVYGTLGNLQYGLKYEGLQYDDTEKNFTHGHGTLNAVPVESTADASEVPYEIGIVKVSPAEEVFLARDYDITFRKGSLTVVPADIGDTARFTVTAPSDVVYNGGEQKQKAGIYDTAADVDRYLDEGSDYTVIWPEDVTDAGTVLVTLEGRGNYTGQEKTAYEIGRKGLAVKTDSAEKVYDGTPLTAPGSLSGLVGGETAELETTGSRTNAGSAANTYRINWTGTALEANYKVESEDIGTLKVTPADGRIDFTESPEKIYDSTPAAEPSVKTDGTGAITYHWYDSEGRELEEAPVDAGTFKVAVEQEADDNHFACRAEMSFVIRKAAAGITQTVSGEGTKETVTAYVTGTYERDGNDGNVVFTVVKDGTQTLVDHSPVPVTRTEDGRLMAELSYDTVPAGKYEVTVQYVSESGNYESPSHTADYDKELARRTITVQEKWTKTYGDAPFALNAAAEAGKATAGDVWSYRVTYDSLSPYGAEPTVSVDENGQVTALHAGTAMIEITLTDGGQNLYETARAAVTITVEKAPLTVTSYAFTEEGETDHAAYGTTGTLGYGLHYDGLIAEKGDTPETFTHGFGTLEAVPVAADAPVSDQPYEIGILRKGADVVIGDQTAEKVFFSRDYEITSVYGSLTVVKREITVRTDSAEKVYDGTPLTAGGAVTGIADPDDYTFAATGTITAPGSAVNTYSLTFEDAARAENYTITEDLGTLTVKEADVLYVYVGSDGRIWTLGGTGKMNFVFKRTVYDELTFGHFAGASVDGKELEEKDYEASQGSLILDLKAEYLNTLTVGKHTLKVMFDDGNDPEVVFLVKDKGLNPTPVNPSGSGGKTPSSGSRTAKTGDDTHMVMWIVILAAAAGAVLLLRRRRRES